ncbi:MAG: family 10 glycosylhydrolase [Bryobacteraceae bacterium]
MRAYITLTLICVFAARASAAEKSNQDNDWTHYVRIAGHSLNRDTVPAIISESEKSDVFGIEVDNDIPGRYESFLDPTDKLSAIRAAAESAHKMGNKAFVYIAGLECITANADKSAHSFFKDHPTWVQRQISGKPAIFGGGTAFWIRPGDEDVWVSPFPPEWRARYMSLIKQIAATGIDGIYVDIPYWMTHFEGWEKSWASFDDFTVAAFRKQTGLDARRDIRLNDVSDPHFRRWIDFRIQALTQFMKEIDSTAKAVNPRCLTIAEIYPGIEEPAPRVGADVYQLYDVVDVIAHEYQGMGADMAASKSAFDWLDQMIGMFSFRAFAGTKATWMLNYSWDGEKNVSIPEAMKTLFAVQLTAGANSWDAQGHVMSGSNDLGVRTQVFNWIAKHEKTFYDERRPVDPIGVYFSPRTRDYFPDEFIRAFKGMMSLLLLTHREFEIVTPRTLSQFSGRVLILPDARCLDDGEIASLWHFTSTGRRLVITGKTGTLQIDGAERAANPLRQLTVEQGAQWTQSDPGISFEQTITKTYAIAAANASLSIPEIKEASARFETDVLKNTNAGRKVSITASPFVLSQVASVQGKLHVFMSNFKGIVAKQNPAPKPESDAVIEFPRTVDSHIYALPYLGERSELTARIAGDKWVVHVPAFTRSIVVWSE